MSFEHIFNALEKLELTDEYLQDFKDTNINDWMIQTLLSLDNEYPLTKLIPNHEHLAKFIEGFKTSQKTEALATVALRFTRDTLSSYSEEFNMKKEAIKRAKKNRRRDFETKGCFDQMIAKNATKIFLTEEQFFDPEPLHTTFRHYGQNIYCGLIDTEKGALTFDNAVLVEEEGPAELFLSGEKSEFEEWPYSEEETQL